MATGDNRRIIQAQALDLAKVNEALRHISEWLNKIEGRTGGIALRDSVDITSNKQTMLDFTSNISGTGSLCLFGTENATLALAKGARKENNGEWIATDSVAVIWALDRAGLATLYVNTGLAINQAFTPTSAFVVGSGGSTAAHGLVSSAHTVSGLTTGDVLTATSATTFAFATPAGNTPDVQTFTATAQSPWTKPTSFTPQWVLVRIWAAGGGGGGAGFNQTTTKRYGGSGGGGGAYNEKLFRASELGATEALVVGVGGTGGPGATVTTNAGTNGVTGGDTTFGTTIKLYAGGGGGGKGAGSGGGSTYLGGGGGGLGGPGLVNSNPGGGPPMWAVNTTKKDGTGGEGANPGPSATDSGHAEWGGAAGGTSNNATPPVTAKPGMSMRGGGGGGCGGSVSGTPAVVAATAGGGSGMVLWAYDLGGAAGTSGGAGTPGADGTGIVGGAGGGGGASTTTTDTVGGKGGAGGTRGGGVGGGGAGSGTTGTSAGGAGGDGGRGEIVVITW